MDTLAAAYTAAIRMDERYLHEHDVIQRYIRHELQADELAAFEILLIADAALIEQIESQRLINAAFKQQLNARKFRSGSLLQYCQPVMRRALPIAATLVLGLFIGLKVVDRNTAITADAPVFTAATLVLEGFRGVSQENIVDMSAMAAGNTANVSVRLPLRIDVGPQPAGGQRYQLQLTETSSGTVLASAGALTASADGWLDYALELPADVRGHYQLQISQHDSSDALQYLLKFR